MQKILIVLVSLLLIAGCGKKNVKEGPDPTAGMDKQSGENASSTGRDLNAGSATSIDPNAATGTVDGFDDPNNPLSKNLIYFDYNSSQVKDVSIVNAHGAYLAGNSSAKVRLEGHADERGSREFNVALSEQRAQSVKRLMMFQGARASQFEIVALGEERPVKFGHSEGSWAENRRVEIIYESK